MAMELKDGVYWVGVVDWGVRHFHGYELSTHRGTTYNAYLIRDEKTVLVDTVWGPFAEEFVDKLREVIDPADLDYVVANHAESDHSGGLPAVMQAAPQATVIVSNGGAESVPAHYHRDWKFRIVSTGERIPIGRDELVFVEAPMLHWPDSMFTYLTGRNILMPNDAFGQHYATGQRFNDEVDQKELYHEALKYYVNILTPFSKQVIRKIDELLALKLPVDMIAPSHGVIWRKDPLQIVETYRRWAQQAPEPTAVILYDTMWQGTRRMAEAIGQGLADEGVGCKMLHMAVTDRNDALVEVFLARTIIIGSPTFNNGLLPTLAPILEEMKGLRFQNKLGAAFGTYGWSGQSLEIIQRCFAETGIPLICEGVRCKWQPGAQELDRCRVFGREIGKATLRGLAGPA